MASLTSLVELFSPPGRSPIVPDTLSIRSQARALRLYCVITPDQGGYNGVFWKINPSGLAPLMRLNQIQIANQRRNPLGLVGYIGHAGGDYGNARAFLLPSL